MLTKQKISINQDYDSYAHQNRQSLNFSEDRTFDTISSGHSLLVNFLLNTLVSKVSLHSRNGVIFYSMRKWRANVKTEQLTALKLLKQLSDDEATRQISEEMSLHVERQFGKNAFTCIVPIPSGSSGKVMGFSEMLARQVAKHLGLPFNPCLINSNVTLGASHPKKSMTLKPYKLSQEVQGNVLLIDDVTTTGRHMELAIKAIRCGGANVSALAWISA